MFMCSFGIAVINQTATENKEHGLLNYCLLSMLGQSTTGQKPGQSDI